MWGISWKSLIAVYPQYTFSTCVCSPLIASGIDSRTTFFRMSLFWSFIQNNHWKGSTWNWSAFLPCLREMKTLATVRGFQQVRFLYWFLLQSFQCGTPSVKAALLLCQILGLAPASLKDDFSSSLPTQHSSNIYGQQRFFTCHCFFGCKGRHQKASMAPFPVFCRGR